MSYFVTNQTCSLPLTSSVGLFSIIMSNCGVECELHSSTQFIGNEGHLPFTKSSSVHCSLTMLNRQCTILKHHVTWQTYINKKSYNRKMSTKIYFCCVSTYGLVYNNNAKILEMFCFYKTHAQLLMFTHLLFSLKVSP